jgi:hypothetical protein
MGFSSSAEGSSSGAGGSSKGGSSKVGSSSAVIVEEPEISPQNDEEGVCASAFVDFSGCLCCLPCRDAGGFDLESWSRAKLTARAAVRSMRRHRLVSTLDIPLPRCKSLISLPSLPRQVEIDTP